MINTARELRKQDVKLSKLMQDTEAYTVKRIKAIKNKDSLRVDIFDARLSQSTGSLKLAREDLEKTLHKAKYLKGIWE